MKSIDLNADVAEGTGNDSEIIPLVTSVNIACGAHAGDEKVILRAIQLATEHRVAIGAHPGYPDRENFGRRPLDMPPDSLRESIQSQLLHFIRICEQCGAEPHHVKPHGALYNQANKDPELANHLAAFIAKILPNTLLYCPPSGELRIAAEAHRLVPVCEGFVDRRYNDDGSLVPRNEAQAVIDHPAEATKQALEIALVQKVTTITGKVIHLPAETLCVHGDGTEAVNTLRLVRQELEKNAVHIAHPQPSK